VSRGGVVALWPFHGPVTFNLDFPSALYLLNECRFRIRYLQGWTKVAATFLLCPTD
jgi:hypothetical protein